MVRKMIRGSDTKLQFCQVGSTAMRHWRFRGPSFQLVQGFPSVYRWNQDIVAASVWQMINSR
jgi:hypothetical protein